MEDDQMEKISQLAIVSCINNVKYDIDMSYNKGHLDNKR